MLEFINSEKGKRLLVHEGMIYRKHKIGSGGKVIWVCVRSDSETKCKGRCWVYEDSITHTSDNHNHLPENDHIEARKLRGYMKRKAEVTADSPAQIIGQALQTCSMAAGSKLPGSNSLRRSIQRTRAKTTGILPTPRTLEELKVTGEYRLTQKGEDFLLADYGEGNERILIFSTRENLQFLSECDHWFADGTFKTTPNLFQQIYTIHGLKYGEVLPAVYTLLPDKRKATYIKMLTKLKELEPQLNPKTVLTDFEKAAYTSFQDVFRDVEPRGCFFHFGQCIFRKIQEHRDILEMYTNSNNRDCNLHIRQLASLAFVPEDDVVKSYEALEESDFFSTIENERILRPLLNYFEDTWIGRINRRLERCEPTFPISLWNCCRSFEENLPRTNNNIEGWHRRFSTLTSSHHPTIWKFIQSLKQDQAVTEKKREDLIAGGEPVNKKKKYADTAKRIQTIVGQYRERNIFDYLRGIAHNFELQVD